MFKRYADFAPVHGTKDHPGQPAYCGEHADVWHRGANFVLFPYEGEPLEFGTFDAAHAHCAKNAELILKKKGERAVTESWKAVGVTLPTADRQTIEQQPDAPAPSALPLSPPVPQPPEASPQE